MPDYGTGVTAFWWVFTLAGALALLACAAQLAQQGWMAWLQVVAASALAIGAGLFPVRVPGTKNAYTAGEIFIFLLLLMLGPAAAAVAAAAEAFAGSARASRRWTSRLFSPASAALAMLAVGLPLQAVLSSLSLSDWGGAAAVLGATMLAAAAYFLLNAMLVSGVLHLKRGAPFFQPAALLSVFRWAEKSPLA